MVFFGVFLLNIRYLVLWNRDVVVLSMGRVIGLVWLRL